MSTGGTYNASPIDDLTPRQVSLRTSTILAPSTMRTVLKTSTSMTWLLYHKVEDKHFARPRNGAESLPVPSLSPSYTRYRLDGGRRAELNRWRIRDDGSRPLRPTDGLQMPAHYARPPPPTTRRPHRRVD